MNKFQKWLHALADKLHSRDGILPPPVPESERRVVINEGAIKKNINPPPVGPRPPPPKAQVAPRRKGKHK